MLLFWARSDNSALDYSDPPRPAMMVPVSLAGVIDDRARFRQIFCALDEDHGSKFPIRRSCKDALQQLGGEGRPGLRPIPVQPRDRDALLHIVIIPGMFGQC